MTSPLVSAMSSLATLWGALTPPGDAAPGYGYLDEHLPPEAPESASASHRAFWFEPRSGGVTREFGTASSQHEHRWAAVLCRSHDGRGARTRMSELVNECVQLIRACNTNASWPAGVDEVRADGYEVKRYDETGATVEIPLVALTRESD